MMRRLVLLMVLMVVPLESWAQDKPDPLQNCQQSLQLANALGKQYYDSRDAMEREKVTYKLAYEQALAKLQALKAELETLKKAKAE